MAERLTIGSGALLRRDRIARPKPPLLAPRRLAAGAAGALPTRKIGEFLATFGDFVHQIWLYRAKSWPYASVYGTEGHRFESCRARLDTGISPA